MSQMDYVRRADLAGKNVQYLVHAALRGSVRRSDPDGIAPYIYVPGIEAGATLFVSIDGAEYITITFTSNSYATILSEANAALAPLARAFDSDGCFGIRTYTIGYNGSVEIIGGTAAPFLGFHLGVRRIFVRGGDLE